ncbi:Fic family protein [Cloacibacillus sp.]|uniref:Fic family protein n=1 Tax=Cloacibacillus sp. TaxID=2049023 RepID=UPI0025BD4034|nr:Fic family protein [Cloacibacillus sp.]MCC8057206.1 Fic family protein [Cloacibacillus sp.]
MVSLIRRTMQAMPDLEKYPSMDYDTDELIYAVLTHYQFEIIHPFLNGNWSVGRLLMMLFLKEKNLLFNPAIDLSYFLKKKRVEYYDRMTDARIKRDYGQWTALFRQALTESADDTSADKVSAVIDELNALHDANITLLGKTEYPIKKIMPAFSYLEANPVIDIKQTSKALGIAYSSAFFSIKCLAEVGILAHTANVMRNQIFAYEAYLNILRKVT